MISRNLKKLLSVALIIALPLVLASTARATMSITFTEGANSVTVSDNGALDSAAGKGLISINGLTFGDISIDTLTLKTKTNWVGNVGYYSLQLVGNSWTTSNLAGAQFTVSVTDPGLNGYTNLNSATLAVGGTTTAQVTGSAAAFNGGANITPSLVLATSGGAVLATPSTGSFAGPPVLINDLGMASTFNISYDPTGVGYGPSLTLTATVPEPGSLLLLGLGLAGLGFYRFRKRKS